MDERPTHLDLFSGIGGFALAAQWAGFRTIGFCEIDRFCQDVICSHWPDVPIWSDVCTFESPTSDLLTGGFPCQPTSHAGRRRGDKDTRWLWPEMLRIIKTSRPTFVVAENPLGLVTWKGGILLDEIYSSLDSENYETFQPIVVPACSVQAPHERFRVWIIAHSRHMPNCSEQKFQQEIRTSYDSGSIKNVTNSNGDRSQGLRSTWECGRERATWESPENETWIEASARFCVMDDGLPRKLAAFRSIGNAIVPQVAYEILREIRKLIALEQETNYGTTRK